MESTKVVRVAIADDCILTRDGIKSQLSDAPEIEIVGEIADGASLMPMLAETVPDVLLLDYQMPQHFKQEEGPENRFFARPAIAAIKDDFPTVKVVVVTFQATGIIVKHLVRAGADGFVWKRDLMLIGLPRVIKAVMSDQHFISYKGMTNMLEAELYLDYRDDISERMIDVLATVDRNRGLPFHYSARELDITQNTLNNHLKKVRKAMGVSSTLEAIDFAKAHGLF